MNIPTIENDYETLSGAWPKTEYQEPENDIIRQILVSFDQVCDAFDNISKKPIHDKIFLLRKENENLSRLIFSSYYGWKNFSLRTH